MRGLRTHVGWATSDFAAHSLSSRPFLRKGFALPAESPCFDSHFLWSLWLLCHLGFSILATGAAIWLPTCREAGLAHARSHPKSAMGSSTTSGRCARSLVILNCGSRYPRVLRNRRQGQTP